MAHGKYFRLSLSALLLLFGLTGVSHAQGKRKTQKVLIETSKPYDRITNAIKARGGKVTWEYEYVDGIAAEIPDDAIEDIRAIVGSTAIDKDGNVPHPTIVKSSRSRIGTHQSGQAVTTLTTASGIATANIANFANSHPEAYSINNAGTRIEKVHAKGFTGKGTIVAVIDSGLRPGYKLPAGSIVGGVDFVDDGDPGSAGDTATDWKKDTNDGHGTFAVGLITGNASFSVGANSIMKKALDLYSPGTLVDGKLSLIGTAPESKIYVVRVFGDAGASTSTVLAAIQHVIEQRDRYDRTGGRQGIKIDVVNLSFGTYTLEAGRSLLDKSVDALLKAGIVPVVSVGNTGPSALTYSSPGSSMSAVSVGASSRAVNERILNEIYFKSLAVEFDDPSYYYPGVGGEYRPFDGTETAWFSSRGPTADGRPDPGVVASGVGNIGQGYCPDQPIVDTCFRRLSIASGTSFSAPIVAGIAAALVDAFPQASATQIRNALIESGRTGQIESYFDAFDRGHGLVDAFGAYESLRDRHVSGSLPRVNQPYDLVLQNIERNTNLNVRSGSITKTLTGLQPGQRAEILYEVPRGTESVQVTVRNVAMNGDQNPYFGGDALFLYVHSAKTSSIGAYGDYLVLDDDGFLVDDAKFFGGEDERSLTFTDPDTGIMRITLNPDTLNLGTVDAEVTVVTTYEAWPHATISDTIRDGQLKKYTMEIPNGTSSVDFLLTWEHDWGHYPTSDIDVYACPPNMPNNPRDCKALITPWDGATQAGPERFSIANPAIGKWTIVVSGFNVPSVSDDFKLRITKH